MKLVILIASSMVLQSVYAGHKMDRAKKTAKIVGHAMTMIGGVVLMGMDGVMIYDIRNAYKRCGQGKSFCNRLRYGISEAMKDGKGSRPTNPTFLLIVNSFGPPLIYSGISGLNRELKLAERMKKLVDKLKKKSEKEVNNN